MEVGMEGRFFIKTEHGEAEMLYRIEGGSTMSIYHTFVPEEERGKGIAEVMADAALGFAKREGLKVRPDCDYMRHYVTKHNGAGKYISQ